MILLTSSVHHAYSISRRILLHELKAVSDEIITKTKKWTTAYDNV